MNLKEKVEVYLEYCEFRKELDKKTKLSPLSRTF